jgi:hypothetical protein
MNDPTRRVQPASVHTLALLIMDGHQFNVVLRQRDAGAKKMITYRLFKISNGTARVAAALLAITFVLMPVGHALAKRLIPDDNLAYPVLITLKSRGGSVGGGSGIY